MASAKPVIIAGSLRAGTTLLRLMLNHHPQISNPGEFDFAFDHVSDDGEPPDVDEYIQGLSVDRIFLAHNLTVGTSRRYRDLVQGFFAQKTEPGKIPTFNIHRGFHKIPHIFADARYIHIIRDPRDVARSSVSMGFAGNTYFGLDHVVESERSWDRLRATLRAEQYLELKYEDLVADPKAQLTRVCDFLGVPYSASMLQFHETSTYGKVDPMLAHQWRTKMSVCELRFVEAKCMNLLLARGYELSGVETARPGWLRELALVLDNKAGRLWLNLRRYGLFLVLMEKLSRVLGARWLKTAVRLRLNAASVSYLK